MADPKGYARNDVEDIWCLDGSARRIARPNYYWVDASTIRIDASTNNPKWFNINQNIYKVTSDLDLVVGGLSTNTAYYIYAIIENGMVTLRYSPDSPKEPVGLEGFTYGNWSYIGAFCTNASSAIEPFRSSRGRYRADENLENESMTGSTNQETTFTCLPVTAHFATVQMTVTGGQATNDSAFINGSNESGSESLFIDNLSTTSGNCTFAFGEIVIITPQIMYLNLSNTSNTIGVNLKGWIEDPTEYP